MDIIGHGWGKNKQTGHPVIMVVKVIVAKPAQDTGDMPDKDEVLHIFLPAFITKIRNNEIAELFAKYFL
jgi:hypothetical protein